MGLQLAALALQGAPRTQEFGDKTTSSPSFTGSHRFVLDYLLEEVLEQQPESIQTFLLRTSILDRMCGPLCEAVLGRSFCLRPGTRGARRLWNISNEPTCSPFPWITSGGGIAIIISLAVYCVSGWGSPHPRKKSRKYHIRASDWYENNALVFEAFHHAAAANDLERADRLIESRGGYPRP